MVVRYSLGYPHSRGTSVVWKNMEHPSFFSIDDGQRFATFSLNNILIARLAIYTINSMPLYTTYKIRVKICATIRTRVVTERCCEVTHQLYCVTSICGTLKRDSRHLTYLYDAVTPSVNRCIPELRLASRLTNCHSELQSVKGKM